MNHLKIAEQWGEDGDILALHLGGETASLILQNRDKPIYGAAGFLFRHQATGEIVSSTITNGQLSGEPVIALLCMRDKCKLAIQFGDEEIFVSRKNQLYPSGHIILYFEGIKRALLITASGHVHVNNGIHYHITIGEDCEYLRQAFLNQASALSHDFVLPFYHAKNEWTTRGEMDG